jgi:serine/threonine protein kinase
MVNPFSFCFSCLITLPSFIIYFFWLDVCSTEKSTGRVMALKIIDIPSAGEEIYDLQHEIIFQMKCDSPHMCKYYASYIRGTELWIFIEYISGGTLSELMRPGPLDEASIRVVIRETARALAFLHCRDLVHRDIKRIELTVLLFFFPLFFFFSSSPLFLVSQLEISACLKLEI